VTTAALVSPYPAPAPVVGLEKRERASIVERIVCAYLTTIPILWALGLLLPVAMVMIAGILLFCVRSRRALAYAAPWFAVGACQIVSVAVNMAHLQQPWSMILKHVFASYVSGWFLLGGAVAIGASGSIRSRPFLRSAARIGFAAAGLAVILYPLALVSSEPNLLVRTPIGLFLSESMPSTSFYFSMLLFNWEETLGVSLPRLSLFSPWATAMGFSGVCLFLISLNEPVRRRRRIALACAAFMVFASAGRLAVLSLALCSAVWWLLGRSRRFLVPAASGAIALVLFGFVASLSSPSDLIEAGNTALDDLRPSASHARDLVYERTWAEIYKSPWVGHGWPGEAVYPSDYPKVTLGDESTMVLGSHSTFAGLLYKGGALTLAAFLGALAWTLFLVHFRTADRSVARSTIALVLAIGMLGFGECLDSLVLPSLFAFLWLGIALSLCRTAPRDGIAGGIEVRT